MQRGSLPQTQLIINILARSQDSLCNECSALQALLRLCMSLTQKRPNTHTITDDDGMWQASLQEFIASHRKPQHSNANKLWDHVSSMITNTTYSEYLDVIGCKHIAHSAFARNEVMKHELNILLDACIEHQNRYKEHLHAS